MRRIWYSIETVAIGILILSLGVLFLALLVFALGHYVIFLVTLGVMGPPLGFLEMVAIRFLDIVSWFLWGMIAFGWYKGMLYHSLTANGRLYRKEDQNVCRSIIVCGPLGFIVVIVQLASGGSRLGFRFVMPNEMCDKDVAIRRKTGVFALVEMLISP